MASLASIPPPPDSSADMTDVDDASDTETSDMKASAEEVMSAINSGNVDALMSALEAFVLSVK